MALNVPSELEKQIDGIITHYPPQHKRAAVLWLLHLLQEHFGQLGKEQVEWTAAKLGLQPINVWELITFYPMFSAKPRGRFHIKVCRTLSCELCGCGSILDRLQKKLRVKLDEDTQDGLFTISTVEIVNRPSLVFSSSPTPSLFCNRSRMPAHPQSSQERVRQTLM